MINTDKSTDLTPLNLMVAGINPNDSNIEFAGIPDTKKVIWIQHGNAHYFKDLDEKVYKLLEKQYQNDEPAQAIIKPMALPMVEQIELYTYYLYGEIDSTPDYANGKLAPSENWRHSENCISLDFVFKNITIGSTILNWREIRMIDMFKKDYKDELVASELAITTATLNYHKKRLYTKAGVQSKAALINIVNSEKI